MSATLAAPAPGTPWPPGAPWPPSLPWPASTPLPPTTPTPPITPSPPVPAAGPTKPKPPTRDRIAALFQEWNDTLATGDPRQMADRYAPDAVLLPTLSDRVRTTRDEIIDYFTVFLGFRPRGTVKRSVVKILGRYAAVDTGVYVFLLTRDGTQHLVEARYTFVYRLRGGKWLIVNHHSSVLPEPLR